MAEQLGQLLQSPVSLAPDCVGPAVQILVKALQTEQRVIIAAHGNSLRALVKYLDHIADDEIAALNIPTGVPLVYELTEELTPIRSFYLGDQQAVDQAMQAVAGQLEQQA